MRFLFFGDRVIAGVVRSVKLVHLDQQIVECDFIPRGGPLIDTFLTVWEAAARILPCLGSVVPGDNEAQG